MLNQVALLMDTEVGKGRRAKRRQAETQKQAIWKTAFQPGIAPQTEVASAFSVHLEMLSMELFR